MSSWSESELKKIIEKVVEQSESQEGVASSAAQPGQPVRVRLSSGESVTAMAGTEIVGGKVAVFRNPSTKQGWLAIAPSRQVIRHTVLEDKTNKRRSRKKPENPKEGKILIPAVPILFSKTISLPPAEEPDCRCAEETWKVIKEPGYSPIIYKTCDGSDLSYSSEEAARNAAGAAGKLWATYGEFGSGRPNSTPGLPWQSEARCSLANMPPGYSTGFSSTQGSQGGFSDVYLYAIEGEPIPGYPLGTVYEALGHLMAPPREDWGGPSYPVGTQSLNRIISLGRLIYYSDPVYSGYVGYYCITNIPPKSSWVLLRPTIGIYYGEAFENDPRYGHLVSQLPKYTNEYGSTYSLATTFFEAFRSSSWALIRDPDLCPKPPGGENLGKSLKDPKDPTKVLAVQYFVGGLTPDPISLPLTIPWDSPHSGLISASPTAIYISIKTGLRNLKTKAELQSVWRDGAKDQKWPYFYKEEDFPGAWYSWPICGNKYEGRYISSDDRTQENPWSSEDVEFVYSRNIYQAAGLMSKCCQIYFFKITLPLKSDSAAVIFADSYKYPEEVPLNTDNPKDFWMRDYLASCKAGANRLGEYSFFQGSDVGPDYFSYQAAPDAAQWVLFNLGFCFEYYQSYGYDQINTSCEQSGLLHELSKLIGRRAVGEAIMLERHYKRSENVSSFLLNAIFGSHNYFLFQILLNYEPGYECFPPEEFPRFTINNLRVTSYDILHDPASAVFMPGYAAMSYAPLKIEQERLRESPVWARGAKSRLRMSYDDSYFPPYPASYYYDLVPAYIASNPLLGSGAQQVFTIDFEQEVGEAGESLKQQLEASGKFKCKMFRITWENELAQWEDFFATDPELPRLEEIDLPPPQEIVAEVWGLGLQGSRGAYVWGAAPVIYAQEVKD